MANEFGDILTPQGYLNEVMQQPNLDVVMNLFKIPRAFAVSGFGDWNVGQHCFCVADLALYWAKHRGYDSAGIATLNKAGLIEMQRATGKLDNLISAMASGSASTRTRPRSSSMMPTPIARS